MKDSQAAQDFGEEIDFLAAARAILRRKLLILSTAVLVAGTTAVVSLLTPNQYTASVTLLPVEKSSSGGLSAALNSMGGGLGIIASQAGLGRSTGPSDKFITILSTRTLAEAVITRKQLLPILFEENWDSRRNQWKTDLGKSAQPSMQEGVEALQGLVSFGKDKKSDVVLVSVTLNDPILAADVANTYVEELNRYLAKNAIFTAKRNRLFIENQLNKAQGELAEYESALKTFQQKNKVTSVEAQADATVKAYAELKAKLVSAEVELSILEKSTLQGDPRTSLKHQEVNEIKKQLAKVESGSESGPFISFQSAPSIGLSYARLKRELMIREKVFELLTQQYEMAKIQEAQEDIAFQVLDPAIPPEKKSGPNRSYNVVLALIGSLLLGVGLALAFDFWEKHKGALILGLNDK